MDGDKRTQGLWAVIGDDESNGIPFIAISAGEMGTKSYRPICEVCSTLDEDTNDFVLTEEDEANAAFIVNACNAYPELVKALTELVEVAEKNIYPKPDVGPKHPWSVLKRAQDVLKTLATPDADHAKREGR